MQRLDQMLTDIRFYEQVLLDSRRTIVCPPDLAVAVQAVVEQCDAANLFTVCASPACPEGRLILIDEQAQRLVSVRTSCAPRRSPPDRLTAVGAPCHTGCSPRGSDDALRPHARPLGSRTLVCRRETVAPGIAGSSRATPQPPPSGGGSFVSGISPVTSLPAA